MKTLKLLIVLVLAGALLTNTSSCKKDNSTVPVLTTAAVSDITLTSAICGGNITSDGGSTITVRGVCWSTRQTPTIADRKTIDSTETGSFTSVINGLKPNTTYNVRSYATNNEGTGYGTAIPFKTLEKIETLETVTDIDGNVYNKVIIGTQTWMKENLKTTKYKDGTVIPLVTDDTAWINLTTPGYCWYNNDATTYKSAYGTLYNWYTVNTEKLCPAGWHVPTYAEWTILTTYLGGNSVAGGKLKEIGTSHWHSPNTGATDESGFTSLPGGCRYTNNGKFSSIGLSSAFWSSTEYDTSHVWYWYTFYASSDINKLLYEKTWGFSVRCLKD